MYTNYDEYELLELFLSEPISLTDNVGDGEIRYIKKGINEFELAVNMYIYELKCTVSLLYKEKDVFYARLDNVTELVKKNNDLLFCSGDKVMLKVHFTESFEISIDNEETNS